MALRRFIAARLHAWVAALAAGGLGLSCDLGPSGSAAKSRGFTEVIVEDDALPKPWGKALGDLDGDGNLDALVGLFGAGVYWYRYPDWEKFLVHPDHGGDDLKASDVDGDGHQDVVSNGSAIVWYRNPRASGKDPHGIWEAKVVYGKRGSHDLIVEDVDRDGRKDIATRVENGATWLFFQKSPGNWTQRTLNRGSGGTGMALGDIDGDDRTDVVGNGYWLRQPKDAAAGEWDRFDFAEWTTTSAVGVADMNGDGRRDIFLAVGHGDGTLCWFESPGDPTRGDWKQHPLGEAGFVHRFHLADMDKDGDLDVVFAEQTGAASPRVGIFVNADGKGLAWETVVIANAGSHNIDLGDVERDGDLDILGADWTGDSRLKVWENGGLLYNRVDQNPRHVPPQDAPASDTVR